MLLFIDTSDLKKVTFALIDAKVIEKTIEIPYHQTNKTLEHLDSFLKEHQMLPRARQLQTVNCPLSTILVCTGPGSFTGVRIGVTLAQALGYAWNIPVVAIKKEAAPKNLKNLTNLKAGRKITVEYNRPAI